MLNYDKFKTFASQSKAHGNLRLRNNKHKHFLSSCPTEHLESPSGTFYCWECISFLTGTRTVDFVIKNRSQMFAVINLVFNMMKKNQLQKKKKFIASKYYDHQEGGSKLSCIQKKQKATMMVRPIIQPVFKYKILMIKMKISYMAWEKGCDILQLFCNAISLTLSFQEYQMMTSLKELENGKGDNNNGQQVAKRGRQGKQQTKQNINQVRQSNIETQSFEDLE